MIPQPLLPIANHLWQSTLFAGMAGLLTLALRKNSARVRHWVCVAASLKFLVPFSLLIAIGSRVEWRTAPAIEPNVSIVVEQVSRPFTLTAASSPVLATAPTAPSMLREILFGIWASGFVGISISWWVRWRRIAAAVRTGSPVQFGLPIRAISSPSFLEPGVFGVFRPILLLPDGIFEHLTPEQWRSVVAHELCHVRHRDNLVAILQMFVETVFWFYPLVWWIGKRIFQERETACDEEVLRLGSEPSVYAQSILRVCELYLESPLECVAGVTGSNLKRRIRDIVTQRRTKRMNTAKKLLVAAAGVVAVAGPITIGVLNLPQIQAQSAPAGTPKFEVVSIKRCQEPPPVPGAMYPPRGNSSPGNLRTNCFPLHDATGRGLIRGAYASDPFTPIIGGPSWIHSAFYEINAKAEGNPSVATMRGSMMQVLLEEHFHLKIHHETTEGPVYFLSVARGGPKLRPFKEGSCIPYPSAPPLPPLQPGQQYCTTVVGLLTNERGHAEAQGATLDEFSKILRPVLDRPVINRTGITGKFDIHIEYSTEGAKFAAIIVMPNDGPPPSPVSDPTGVPSIFTAMQEQLGLRLESAKGPVDRFVIDHIERPSEN
ncbi:MAG TPA: M56 family metallopeptidase [Bryobacteraceae bacterium]